jgi:hypothetical protein
VSDAISEEITPQTVEREFATGESSVFASLQMTELADSSQPLALSLQVGLYLKHRVNLSSIEFSDSGRFSPSFSA